MTRMRCEPTSATKRVLPGPIATPMGRVNVAADDAPSAYPMRPLPAKVLIVALKPAAAAGWDGVTATRIATVKKTLGKRRNSIIGTPFLRLALPGIPTRRLFV